MKFEGDGDVKENVKVGDGGGDEKFKGGGGE